MKTIRALACILLVSSLTGLVATAEGSGTRWDVMPYTESLYMECIDSALNGDTPEMQLVICEDIVANLEVLEDDIADWAPVSAEMNHLHFAMAQALDGVGEANALLADNPLSQTRCEYVEAALMRMARMDMALSAKADADFYGIIYRGFEDKARMCRRHWPAPEGAIAIDTE